jgi:class 3 adenylate cyclase
MKIFFVCLFVFSVYVSSVAQDKVLDSLRSVIEKAGNDTLKVNSLLELSRRFINVNPDAAIHFAKEALELAQRLGYKKGEGLANKNIGLVYYNKASYVEAVNYWQLSLAIYDSIGFKEGVANIQSNLGAIYFNQAEDAKALEYYFSALKTAEDLKDTLRITTTLQNIAAVYQRKPNTEKKALEFYLRALALEEIVQDNDLIGSTAAGIGEIYLKKDSAALDTALYYFEKSQLAFKGTLDEPYALNLLGKVYLKRKDFEKAIRYQKEGFEIAKKFESKDDMAIALTGLGQTYLQKGDTRIALSTFAEAEELAVEVKANYLLEEIYIGKVDAYGKLHDYKNGFKYQYLLRGIKDTIYKIEVDQKLQGVQFNFEIEKKEGQISLLTKDKQLQDQELRRQKIVRNSFVGGFAIVLLFAGIFFNQRNKISKEKKRSDELLLNILPSETAEELKTTGTAKTKSFDSVTVMFTDFKNFTQASEILTPEELVSEINLCYSVFDEIVTRYGIEKIKTIGDSYMCAGGLPVSNLTHPFDVVNAGIEMQQFIDKNKTERIAKGQPFFELRLGIHTGPVVAGIVGTKKFAYDIWGDTVNTASRMESSGEIGKVNISGSTYELVKDKFKCLHRGKVKAKNKGDIDMYFVEGKIA